MKVSFGFYVLNLVTLNDYKNNIYSSIYYKTLFLPKAKLILCTYIVFLTGATSFLPGGAKICRETGLGVGDETRRGPKGRGCGGYGAGKGVPLPPFPGQENF